MVLPKPQHYTAKVAEKMKLTDNVWIVTFALQNPSELQFIAGQTMMLHVADTVNRSMSIASPPKTSTALLMCHDVSPMGPGSRWTLGLKVGDTVSLVAPLGIFVLDKESHRKKIMIATGTGVVPFRSMLYDYLEHGGTDDITLYWGLRYEQDMYWQKDFLDLSKRYQNFHFILTLSQPTDHWQGTRGRVTDHVFDDANLIGGDFYLCGSKAMVDEVKVGLLARNVPKEQIKTELFF